MPSLGQRRSAPQVCGQWPPSGADLQLAVSEIYARMQICENRLTTLESVVPVDTDRPINRTESEAKLVDTQNIIQRRLDALEATVHETEAESRFQMSSSGGSMGSGTRARRSSRALSSSIRSSTGRPIDNVLPPAMCRVTIDDAQTQITYKPEESMWDAAMFIGTALLSFETSLSLSLCVVLNSCMSCLFTVLCASFLIVPAYDNNTKLDFELWRTMVAHDISYRNPFTDESLASSVCDERLHIPFSGAQVSKVTDLREYLRPFWFASEGYLMCMLSVMVWILIVFCEIRKISRAASAIWKLPNDPQDRLVIEEGNNIYLGGVSSFRRLSLLMLFMLRSVQCFFLATFGCAFLVYTSSVTDLLLNALALEVVLRMDEVIFWALAPTPSHILIRRILPVRFCVRSKRWHNFVESLFLFSAFGVSIECIRRFELSPYTELLREHLDSLCGGSESSLNFVVALDSIGIPWAAKTPPSTGRTHKSYAMWVVEQFKNSEFPEQILQPRQRINIGLVMQVASAQDLDVFKKDPGIFGRARDWGSFDTRNLENVKGWNELQVRKDRDFGDAAGTVYMSFLRHVLQQPRATNPCQQVSESSCSLRGSSSQAAMMRQLCPSRCGCNNPYRGTISNPLGTSASLGFLGCARWNVNTVTFQTRLGKVSCSDTTDRQIFARWSTGFGNAKVFGVNGAVFSIRDGVMASFDSGGCAKVVNFVIGDAGDSRSNICSETTLAAVCPASCGCNASSKWVPAWSQDLTFCPLSCGRNNSMCFTIANQNDGGFPDYIKRTYLAGYACMFPFEYRGRTHNRCISEGWHTLWCPVAVNHDLTYIKWGECDKNCDR